MTSLGHNELINCLSLYWFITNKTEQDKTSEMSYPLSKIFFFKKMILKMSSMMLQLWKF